MTKPPSADLLKRLERLLGPRGFVADQQAMAPCLTDWRGRFHGRAAAMLSPSGLEEVAEIVRLCAEESVPLVPQGGNTSMVGGATPDETGSALLLSLRRMNQIRRWSADSVICEAGLILSNLHDAAAERGKRFPLTLGAKGSATIGGLVSTNAGGTQVLRFGTMRALVAGVEAVLADGTVFDSLVGLKKDNRGYDLGQLLIGAEGTLGIVTAARLKLRPAVERGVAWIGLDTPAEALALLRSLEDSLEDRVESFELVPDSSLQLVLEHIAGTRAPLEGRHAWHVLVEAAGPSGSAVAASLADALGRAGAVDAALAANEGQAEAFWKIRDSISEAERKDGPAAKHDISVPVEEMPRFMVEAAQAVEQRFSGTRVNAFGHLGDGNIHFNVRAPAGAGASWLEETGRCATMFVHDLVVASGGSISAEHGIGQMKLHELARLAGPSRLNALRAIKKALDPNGIMNPGKLVPFFEQAQQSLAEETHRP